MGFENPVRLCGKFFELSGRPNRPPHQFAPTIWTQTRKMAIGTFAAKCAFKRTDHRVTGCGRQIPVTTFTIGSECQHLISPPIKKSAGCVIPLIGTGAFSKTHFAFGLMSLRLMQASAIWMAFKAAPLRRLSDTHQKARPFSTVGSLRMREI